MIHEFDIGGIYIAPIVAFCAAAIPIFLILRLIFGRLGLFRAVWHPSLFEAALYLSILSLLVLLWIP